MTSDLRIDNWDDLRLFLAVARSATVAEAARTLGVDPTTVTRRVQAFEDALGRKLFDRLRGGVVLSPDGEALRLGAAETEAAVRNLELRVAGRADEVSGTVRVAVAELLVMVWSDALIAMAETWPALDLQIIAGDEMHSLSKREADIAVRVAASPPSHLVGRRFPPIATAVYVSASLEERHDVSTMPWIGWSGLGDEEGVIGQTRKELGATGRFVLRANSYGLLLDYARRGAGAVVLPCALGDGDPVLHRATEPRRLPQPLWVLTHPDLQRTPRVQTVFDELVNLIGASGDALSP